MPYSKEYIAANRDRIRTYQREWKRRNSEQNKASCREQHRRDPKARTLRKYGLSKEDFSALIGEQMNLCAICRCPMFQTGTLREDKCCIDHNHSSGKVRGLLCNPCNQGLGRFMDSPERLLSAAQYLRERDHAAA